MPSNWWRAAITTIIGAGLITRVTVLRYKPKRFYRRVFSAWIGLNVVLNTIGFVVDGFITRNDATVRLAFASDLAWWWVIWAIIAVALLAAGQPPLSTWPVELPGNTRSISEGASVIAARRPCEADSQQISCG